MEVHLLDVMNPLPPNRPGPPEQPTPEAWALRAEWRKQPPSLAREQAGRGLEALGQTAAGVAGAAVSEEVPPVPEELRARWAEAYGRPTGEERRPANRESEARGVEARGEGGRWDWLAALLTPRRVAWSGGVGAAAAMLSIVMVQEQIPSGTGERVPAGVVTRSPSAAPAGGETAPVAVIAPAAAEAMKDGVVFVLAQAFPGRPVNVLASAHEAAALAQREPRLIVINLGSGLVTAWSGGRLADEFPLAAGSTPDAVVDQVESADENLEAAPPVVP